MKHFKKALNSHAYKDKICSKIEKDETRDKILNSTLSVDECSDKDVCEFLALLKRENERSKTYQPMSMKEWRTVVMRSKVRSCSSVFSKRTHAACKCALHSTRLTQLLVDVHNVMIKEGVYVNIWTKILDIIIEKGKGPILEKLRVTQLIEADFQLLLRIDFGLRNDANIENDDRISKYNYRSRKGYSM